MRPFTPLMSPPALPMNTKPFQAIGAAGALSPFFVIADRRLPDPFARLEIVGEHAAVLRSAEKHAIQIGGAAIDPLRSGGLIVFVRPPVLLARGRIDGDEVVFGHEDEGAVHLEQPGGEAVYCPVS